MSYYHDDDGSDEEAIAYRKNLIMWTVIIVAFGFGMVFLIEAVLGQETHRAQWRTSGGTSILGGCDDSLWKHVYNPDRLQVHKICASVTGTFVDATHGKRKDGCRTEADGDLHCWLSLDPGQEKYVNQENVDKQEGNLVFEPMCQHKVTQADAVAACKNFKQKIALPAIGAHVRISGSFVTDLQHGHMEIHPVTSIEALKTRAPLSAEFHLARAF